MKNNVRGRIGIIFTACGLLMIVAALCLLIYNLSEDERAGDAAGRAVEGINAVLDSTDTDESPLYKLYPDMEMHSLEFNGNEYIGRLDIPDLGLTLPVMSKWSYPNLRTSPCRYSGSAYTGDMVVAAHNYKRHFGNIKKLNMGSTVTFTDMSNNRFEYRVSDIEEISPSDVDALKNDERSLTLITCNVSGSRRIAVRCIEVGDDM
jgi:sortase A